MYLHRTQRRKNGKDHEYWSIVESRRLADGRVVQRHVLYLGEINDAQERAWARSIQVLTDDHPEPQLRLLLERLKLTFPAQPPPRITATPTQTEAPM